MKPKITIDNKIGEIEEFYVSELGFLMVKVHYPDENKFTRYNLGNYDQTVFTSMFNFNFYTQKT